MYQWIRQVCSYKQKSYNKIVVSLIRLKSEIYLPLWPCRKIWVDQLSGSDPFDSYATPGECLWHIQIQAHHWPAEIDIQKIYHKKNTYCNEKIQNPNAFILRVFFHQFVQSIWTLLKKFPKNIGALSHCTRHAEWTLSKIEKTFNGTFAGWKCML